MIHFQSSKARLLEHSTIIQHALRLNVLNNIILNFKLDEFFTKTRHTAHTFCISPPPPTKHEHHNVRGFVVVEFLQKKHDPRDCLNSDLNSTQAQSGDVLSKATPLNQWYIITGLRICNPHWRPYLLNVVHINVKIKILSYSNSQKVFIYAICFVVHILKIDKIIVLNLL